MSYPQFFHCISVSPRDNIKLVLGWSVRRLTALEVFCIPESNRQESRRRYRRLSRVMKMRRQLLIGILLLLAYLLPCIGEYQQNQIILTQSVDAIEPSDCMAIEAEAYEIRNRFFVKSPLMKRIDTATDTAVIVSSVVRYESKKQDTKTETIYDFYAREAGGMPATTTFLR